MTVQRYTFTIRPPSSFHCPPGWIPDSMRTTDPPTRFDHGTVDYPEPLDIKVADHWSLIPVGPRVTAVWVDGERSGLMQVFGQDGLRLAYELAVGWLSPTMVRVMVASKAAEYGVDIRVEIDGEERWHA